jgi:hypothetical protein
MKTVILALLSTSLYAASDSEKLKVREAQNAAQAAFIRLQQVQADPTYRKAVTDFEEADKALKAALDAYTKKNCGAGKVANAALECVAAKKP